MKKLCFTGLLVPFMKAKGKLVECASWCAILGEQQCGFPVRQKWCLPTAPARLRPKPRQRGHDFPHQTPLPRASCQVARGTGQAVMHLGIRARD